MSVLARGFKRFFGWRATRKFGIINATGQVAEGLFKQEFFLQGSSVGDKGSCPVVDSFAIGEV